MNKRIALVPLVCLFALLVFPVGAEEPPPEKVPAPDAKAHRLYNDCAKSNAIWCEVMRDVQVEENGKMVTRQQLVRERVKGDEHGNALGNQFDLARDGAFDGATVAVLHFYTMENFDFSKPKAALKKKGFSVFRWVNTAPDPDELEEKLEKACQLWIISDGRRHLNDKHIAVIKKFFDSGKGVYIWGDNEPYYADANAVGKALVGATMNGNLNGSQKVGLKLGEEDKSGIAPQHLITTGIETLYEGITIATIDKGHQLTPLIHGSAGNLVAAVYDVDGKRAIFDGGFTRLYCHWDTAGTARYVKNAAAWLTNVEKFGEEAFGKLAEVDE